MIIKGIMPYTKYDCASIGDILEYVENLEEDMIQIKNNMHAIEERLDYLCKNKDDWEHEFKYDSN